MTKEEAVFQAIKRLEKQQKNNIKYRVYPQDVVGELNRMRSNRFFQGFYNNIHCTTKEVEEIMHK